ncbi:MAG: hypothetical protein ACLVHQ_01580 [Oscillospiraceae bacterium]
MTKKRYLNYYALRLFFRITDSFASFAERKSQTIRLIAIFLRNGQRYIRSSVGFVAKTGEDVLLNHVTCDVIKFYKEYGYETVDMDGNPADFIGQQLRFAEYPQPAASKVPWTKARRAGPLRSLKNNFSQIRFTRFCWL